MVAQSALLGDYLRARRGQIEPEEVGLVAGPGRRVSGLRRQEVADLAGISREYYLRLEQGRDRGPSDQVLIALATALRLGDAGVFYMRRLVNLQNGDRARPLSDAQLSDVEEQLSSMLALWETTPAIAFDRNQDVVGSNAMARRFGAGAMQPGQNIVLDAFGEQVRRASAEWRDFAGHAVASLRFHGDPSDGRFREIVGVLSMRDPDFRELWARHDARPWDAGRVTHRVDGLGDVPLRFQNLSASGWPGYTISVFHAEPGSTSAAALAYLAAARDDFRQDVSA